jgi:hypothetical protein
MGTSLVGGVLSDPVSGCLLGDSDLYRACVTLYVTAKDPEVPTYAKSVSSIALEVSTASG